MATLVAGLLVLAAPAGLERSYWLHASLGRHLQRGYWGPDFPADEPPSRDEIAAAAALLAGHYQANRLYLIVHREMNDAQAARVLADWAELCPAGVELVPTFVLAMYDAAATPVWRPDELADFVAALPARYARLAVYDVYPNRPQPAIEALRARAEIFRVGLQPGEPPRDGVTAAVQDTWSAFCHGKLLADWRAAGAVTLRGWVGERNAGTLPVAWDLIAVAWDYAVTEHGEYPGYDDAARNMALPAGRNRHAARLIRETARPEVLGGFSSDLFILEVNARHANRDGPDESLYTCLRRGEVYAGYFSAALEEIAGIYRDLAAGLEP